MKIESIQFNQIPAIMYGESSDKVFLFVHGQHGCKEEAAPFAKIAVSFGYQVCGIDLPKHGSRKHAPKQFSPQAVVPELQEVLKALQKEFPSVSLRANSIGAYFSMCAFAKSSLHQALLVSPIVDMEHLILQMMQWANVTEHQLKAQEEILTDFGQTLSWSYLCWVRAHPLSRWRTPTCILYPGKDDLTARETMEAFARRFQAALTVYEPGEHWFHRPEQLAQLYHWELQQLQSSP